MLLTAKNIFDWVKTNKQIEINNEKTDKRL